MVSGTKGSRCSFLQNARVAVKSELAGSICENTTLPILAPRGVQLLPCCIEHTGPAKTEVFFHSLERPATEGVVRHAAFRGRELAGVNWQLQRTSVTSEEKPEHKTPATDDRVSSVPFLGYLGVVATVHDESGLRQPEIGSVDLDKLKKDDVIIISAKTGEYHGEAQKRSRHLRLHGQFDSLTYWDHDEPPQSSCETLQFSHFLRVSQVVTDASQLPCHVSKEQLIFQQ
eukprot:GHVT01100683.1.p1 GENE.GHVT01100683.1~~GHVT01100683.1.p1  ORF type:complete len:229 (+),score=16.23 GHVT01100683.1:1479-2165(+)